MSSNGYDAAQVQEWITEIEEALTDENRGTMNDEQTEVLASIRVHYTAAQQKIMDEGLSEEASYEIEVAHNLLENDYKIAKHLDNDDTTI